MLMEGPYAAAAAAAARRRLPTGGPRCYESTNRCSPGGLHRQPTCHTVRGWRAGVGSRAGRVTAARISCCGWHQKRPLALWPIEPTVFAPGSHAWLLAGKDRRLSHGSCGRPLCTAKATASQQAVACMKHLVEAERGSSVPSSKPKNFGRPGTRIVRQDYSFGMALDTIRCVSRLTELIKKKTASGRPNSNTCIHSRWRGAVTSSSDQSKGRKHEGFQRTPTKISLQINWGQAGRAAGSGAASARERYISLGRGYLFVELHAV